MFALNVRLPSGFVVKTPDQQDVHPSKLSLSGTTAVVPFFSH